MTINPSEVPKHQSDIPTFERIVLPDRTDLPRPTAKALVALEKFLNRCKFEIAVEVAANFFQVRVERKTGESTFHLDPNALEFINSFLKTTGFESAFKIVEEGFRAFLEKSAADFREENPRLKFDPSTCVIELSSDAFINELGCVHPQAAELLGTLASDNSRLRREAPAQKLYVDKIVPIALADIANQLIQRLGEGVYFCNELQQGGEGLLRQLGDYLAKERGLLIQLDKHGAFAVPESKQPRPQTPNPHFN